MKLETCNIDYSILSYYQEKLNDEIHIFDEHAQTLLKTLNSNIRGLAIYGSMNQLFFKHDGKIYYLSLGPDITIYNLFENVEVCSIEPLHSDPYANFRYMNDKIYAIYSNQIGYTDSYNIECVVYKFDGSHIILEDRLTIKSIDFPNDSHRKLFYPYIDNECLMIDVLFTSDEQKQVKTLNMINKIDHDTVSNMDVRFGNNTHFRHHVSENKVDIYKSDIHTITLPSNCVEYSFIGIFKDKYVMMNGCLVLLVAQDGEIKKTIDIEAFIEFHHIDNIYVIDNMLCFDNNFIYLDDPFFQPGDHLFDIHCPDGYVSIDTATAELIPCYKTISQGNFVAQDINLDYSANVVRHVLHFLQTGELINNDIPQQYSLMAYWCIDLKKITNRLYLEIGSLEVSDIIDYAQYNDDIIKIIHDMLLVRKHKGDDITTMLEEIYDHKDITIKLMAIMMDYDCKLAYQILE
jgi:hypothetical protein